MHGRRRHAAHRPLRRLQRLGAAAPKLCAIHQVPLYSTDVVLCCAAAGPAPLEFIYVGDAQNDIFSMWSHLIRAGYSEAPRARFILHAGDLANQFLPGGRLDQPRGEDA